MPKSFTMNVRVTDSFAFKEFLTTIGEVRDYCKGYDEANGNYGDVDLIGERLDDAIQDLWIELKRLSEKGRET